MKTLVNYLGCGWLYVDSSKSIVSFSVSNLSDPGLRPGCRAFKRNGDPYQLFNNIFPFFDKYPIQGEKSPDYEDFKRAAELMKEKVHLTP
jgi:hypothetical protein